MALGIAARCRAQVSGLPSGRVVGGGGARHRAGASSRSWDLPAGLPLRGAQPSAGMLRWSPQARGIPPDRRIGPDLSSADGT